jgi:hypothetical protein
MAEEESPPVNFFQAKTKIAPETAKTGNIHDLKDCIFGSRKGIAHAG